MQSVFSGLVVLRVTPMNGSLSLLQTGYVLGSQPFSAVDVRNPSAVLAFVNAQDRCKLQLIAVLAFRTVNNT
jgi:hypothetical protein